MLTPIKAIRAKCLDCCCGSAREVELHPLGVFHPHAKLHHIKKVKLFPYSEYNQAVRIITESGHTSIKACSPASFVRPYTETGQVASLSR